MKISANRQFHTKDTSKAYRIQSGTICVYSCSLVDGEEVFRSFLTEASENFVIPGCSFDTVYEDLCFSVHLVMVATTDAELEEIENSKSIEDQFCKSVFPGQPAENGLNSIIREYLIDSHKNKIKSISLAEKATKSAQERVLTGFKSIFSRDNNKRSYKTMPSGNMVYDASARLCDWLMIDIAPYTSINHDNPKIRIEDISRISGFVTRDVILEPGWHKKDLGPLLIYGGKDRQPWTLLPKSGGGGYCVWQPETQQTIALTDEIIKVIDPKAVMFYKSFPHKSMSLRDLFRFASEYLRGIDVLVIFLMLLFETLIGILLPTMNEKIYDLFIPLGDASGLLGMGYVIIACTMGNVAFGLVKGFTNYGCFNRIKYSVQAATFDRLFNMPSSFTREYDSAVLAEKALGAGEIIDLLSKTVFLTGFATLFSFFYYHKMRKYSVKMTKVAVIALLICMVIIVLLGISQIKNQEKKKKTYNSQSSILYQLISAIDKLRIAGAEDRGLAQYFGIYEKTALYEREIGRVKSWNDILNTAMSLVSSIIFYYLMIRKDMDLSMGNFMAFTTAFGAFSSAMLQLVSSGLDLSAIKPDYEELKPILETIPEIDTTAALPGEITGRIDVSDVSFAYNDDHYILENFSLNIKSGEYVGVVGSSGCGKSTLLKLLLGFETPQNGKVYYDDKDIEAINKRELRKQFGVVLQNGDTISGSIYDNITITDPTVPMEDVEQAVKDAGLEEDIAKLPMGLNTVLSEGGGGVSGGQKQRILIARAIVTKPKVLFFDEATSALDNKTQQQICDSIEKLSCTKFIIAHRLSTIMNCDRIIVMDKGKIVEEGTYSQLMELDGLFCKLAKRQMA